MKEEEKELNSYDESSLHPLFIKVITSSAEKSLTFLDEPEGGRESSLRCAGAKHSASDTSSYAIQIRITTSIDGSDDHVADRGDARELKTLSCGYGREGKWLNKKAGSSLKE